MRFAVVLKCNPNHFPPKILALSHLHSHPFIFYQKTVSYSNVHSSCITLQNPLPLQQENICQTHSAPGVCYYFPVLRTRTVGFISLAFCCMSLPTTSFSYFRDYIIIINKSANHNSPTFLLTYISLFSSFYSLFKKPTPKTLKKKPSCPQHKATKNTKKQKILT